MLRIAKRSTWMISSGETSRVSTGSATELIGGLLWRYVQALAGNQNALSSRTPLRYLLTLSQWALGVFPSMPGFVSNVNNDIQVSLGWTRVYYLSFLVGLAISSIVFIALHHFFPAPSVKDFVLNPATSREVMAKYQARWDATEDSGCGVPTESVLPKDVRDVDSFPKDV